MFMQKDFIIFREYLVVDSGANLFRGTVVGFLDGRLVLENGSKIVAVVIETLVHIQEAKNNLK